MRIYISVGLAIAALVLGAAGISAQDRKDGGTGTDKGQSERPVDPKHNEPESSSHNADKPKQQSGTSSTQTQSGETKQPTAPSTTPSKK